MDVYTSFAKVYDMFMDNIPYEAWSHYIQALLTEYGIMHGLVLDLGCGTGSMTEQLSKKGYDMIGIDAAEEMLQIAMEKKEKSGSDILYLLQDMREFELYGTVAAVICICDSLNYIIEYNELVDVFRLINNYLDPDGILIFDLNTIYKYEQLLGEATIAENRENSSFIWDNFYNHETKINEYDLTLFIQEDGNKYRRYEETHYQKAYSLDDIKCALKEAGMQFLTSYDAFTKNPPHSKSERIYIIAREHGKV